MNPFLPEFREATPLPNQDIDGCLQLNAVDRYYECYEFIDMLTRPTIADDERNDNLEIEFFKLIDDEMPVVDLDPRRLDVSRLDEPYGGDGAGARRRRLPRKHNTRVASSDVPPASPAFDFAELSSNCSSHDSEGEPDARPPQDLDCDMDFVDAMSDDRSVLECETPPGSPDDHEGGCEPPGDDGVDDMVVDAAMDGGDDEAVVEAGAIDGADGHIPLHGADHALDVPGGTLRLYKHANVIRAFCKCSTHKKCVVERTCAPNRCTTFPGETRRVVSFLASLATPSSCDL